MTKARKPYDSDVHNEEWEFVAPYLMLMDQAAPQREYPLREAFDARLRVVRTGASWRLMPHDFPPWHAVYDRARRRLDAGGFEAIVLDLRELLRLAAGREIRPTATIFCSRTPRSTPGRRIETLEVTVHYDRRRRGVMGTQTDAACRNGALP